MNVVKCVNGHFFDADTYTQCPHCGAAPAKAAAEAGKGKSERQGFSLFGKKNGNKATAKSAADTVQEQIPVKQVPPQETVQEAKEEISTDGGYAQMNRSEAPAVQKAAVPPAEKKKDLTIDVWQPVSQTPEKPEQAPLSHLGTAGMQTSEVLPEPERSRNFTPGGMNAAAVQEPVGSGSAADALREAVRAASASSETKTMSYFSTVAPASAPTAAPASAAADAPQGAAPAAVAPVKQNTGDPVVGWLVCIQGPCVGWSFQIGAGNNSIGRKEDNRIVIPGDMKISGTRHATIAYEPKRRNFFLHPGDASGLTYLNDEYITAPQKLSPRDIIELGDSKMLFVPLCDESFSWETYLK